MKKVEIESLKLFGERMYKLLGGAFQNKKRSRKLCENKNFQKAFLLSNCLWN